MSRHVLLLFALLGLSRNIAAQDSAALTPIEVQDRFIHKIDQQVTGMNEQLSKTTGKYLNSLARQEEKIFKKLKAFGSSAAPTAPGNVKEKYNRLSQKLSEAGSKTDRLLNGKYIPGIDSLATSLSFLKEAGNIVSGSKDIQQQISSSLQNLQQLQSKLNEAENIRQFVQQRQQQLKELLSDYTNLPKDISKCFGRYQQTAFYYSQQLAGLRESLDQPDKLIAKTLAVLQKIPAFQTFWKKHSMLSRIFPEPDNYGTPQALAGLQTRASVQQLLQQQIGVPATSGANANPAQYLQQQLQQAQGELSKLKEKLNQLGSGGGSSDMVMPEGFTPNPEKTKSFLKRVQLGTTIQSQRATNYFPVHTDIAVTAAYKLNNHSKLGVGILGRAGWGNGWKQVRLTAEGVGLRVYAEKKAPDLFKTSGKFISSLWLYAGAELHYHRTIESLSEFKNYSNYSKSALAGLSKKYSMSSPLKKGKKVEGSMQVLYDFMHRKNIPNTPAFVWRVGYEF